MVKVNLWIFLFCFLILSSCQLQIASLLVNTKQQIQEGCVLLISNTEQLLDIRSQCSSNIMNFLRQKNDFWISLIPKNISYYLEQNEKNWKGYRYFKHHSHYKKYNLTIFEQTLNQFLHTNQLLINLHFDDHFRITLRLIEQQWRLDQIKLQYVYHNIDKIADQTAYNFEYTYRNVTNVAQSKNKAIRKLRGNGLHQEVNLTLQLIIETNIGLTPDSCKIIISQILPESTYIDVDQLRTITKFEQINVQRPQYLAKQYYYEYQINFKKFIKVGASSYNYLYPIHFRYPQPSNQNYTKISLHPSDRIILNCGNTTNYLINEDPFIERGVANIFVGTAADRSVVSMVTFILMIVAAMILMRQLRKQ